MEKTDIAKMASALLADIERGELPIELVVVKALSLARAAGDSEAIDWLTYESVGYDSSNPVGEKYAQLTARWDGKSGKGYFGSAAGIAHSVASMTQSLEVAKQFQPSG